MGLDPFSIALLSIAGTATAASIHSSRKARKASKKAAKVASRRRAIESRRATIANIEDARQAIGTIQNVGGLTGTLGGSGVQGGVGSLVTQLGANNTFNQQLLQFAQRQEHYMQKAMNAQNRAQSFSQIASLAMSATSMIDTSPSTGTQVSNMLDEPGMF